MGSGTRTPSVLAKLMSLDEPAPPQPVQKQQRVLSEHYFQKAASIGIRQRRLSHGHPPFRLSIEEQKELSYIFRVLDKNRHKPHNLSVEERKASSSSTEERLPFKRQNFGDAKCISLDKNPMDLQNAMKIKDLRDPFAKYLQEEDSLSAKHFHDCQGVSPDPQSGHVAVLKSSHSSYSSNIPKSGKSPGKTAKGNVTLLRKPENGLGRNPHGELGLDNICESARSQVQSNSEACHSPTKIGILKENNTTVENDALCFSFSSPGSFKGSLLGNRKLKDFPIPENGILDIEVKERKNWAYEMGPARQWPRVPREVSEEVKKQKRQVTIGISTKVSRSGLRGKDTFTEESKLMMSASFSDWKNECKLSLPFSDGSYVAREAIKKISERWKMNQKSYKDGLACRVITLGELPATTDDETGARNANYRPNKCGTGNQTCPNDGHVYLGELIRFISRSGLNDQSVRKFPRSRSLFASSSATRNPRPRTRYEGFQNHWCLSQEETVNWSQHQFRRPNLNQKDGFDLSNLFGYKEPYSSAFLDTKSIPTVEEPSVVQDQGKNKLEKDLCNQNVMDPLSSSSTVSSSDVENSCIVQSTQVVDGEMKNMLKNRNMSAQNILIPQPSVCSVASVSMVTDPVASVEGKSVGRPSESTKEEQLEPIACFLATNSYSSCHASSTSIPQEASVGFNEEGSVFSRCSCKAPGSTLSLEDASRNSPVSVLEPLFKEDLSCSSECLESVTTDISDVSETHSEGPGIIVSSEEDFGEGSVHVPEEKVDLMGFLRVEESRDFSYLVDVLTEAGFHGGILDVDVGTWHSAEYPISLLVFENLEKKFGEQASWKRSERRLLFDRSNSGLIEIFQSCMGVPHLVPKWANPVSKRLNNRLTQVAIEEDLWMWLVGQEKEASKDSAAKVLQKELGSLDLGDDIDLIGREIERLLIDELAAEVVSTDTY